MADLEILEKFFTLKPILKINSIRMIFNTIIGNKKASQMLLNDPEKLKKKQVDLSRMILNLLKKSRPLISKDEQYRQPFNDEYKWNRVILNFFNKIFSSLFFNTFYIFFYRTLNLGTMRQRWLIQSEWRNWDVRIKPTIYKLIRWTSIRSDLTIKYIDKISKNTTLMRVLN